jgi:hypothetical protein
MAHARRFSICRNCGARYPYQERHQVSDVVPQIIVPVLLHNWRSHHYIYSYIAVHVDSGEWYEGKEMPTGPRQHASVSAPSPCHARKAH